MSKIFARLAYGYIALPILIFFIGWCNPLVAVLGSIILLVSFYFACKNAPELWYPTSRKQWFFLISLVVVALVWVCWSGIGALVFQNADHKCRNPIFELLVTHNWPVIASFRKGFFSTIEHPIVMTYYIGFWLPPALVGKLFNSVQVGYYAQIIWATFGVFLVFYYILASVKKKNYLPIFLFLIFSGMDFLGATLLKKFYLYPLTAHMEWWLDGFNYESFTTQLFWVFNQALPAWIMTLMLLHEKNNKSILFLYSCLLIHATLPSMGLFPIVVYLTLKNGNPPSKDWFTFNYIKDCIRSAFTFQNTLGMFLITVISYFYLSQNISGGNMGIAPLIWLNIAVYMIIYFPLEIGIYLVLLWKYNKCNPLFYLITAWLLVIPHIQVGFTIDFGMRACIPSLVILFLFVAKTLDEGKIQKDKFIYAILILALAIGAVSPLHEFSRTVIRTSRGITKAKSELSVPNFFAYIQDNKFMMYFGKKPKGGTTR